MPLIEAGPGATLLPPLLRLLVCGSGSLEGQVGSELADVGLSTGNLDLAGVGD